MPLVDVGKDFPYYAMVGRYLRRVRGRSFRTRAPSLFAVGLDDDQWRRGFRDPASCRGVGRRYRGRWWPRQGTSGRSDIVSALQPLPFNGAEHQMEMDEGLSRKYDRLRSLLRVGNADAPHIKTEIADLIRDIKGSGHSDEDIVARTDPRRFDAGFNPVAPVSAQEEEIHVED